MLCIIYDIWSFVVFGMIHDYWIYMEYSYIIPIRICEFYLSYQIPGNFIVIEYCSYLCSFDMLRVTFWKYCVILML